MASSINNAFITQYGRRKPKMPQKRTRPPKKKISIKVTNLKDVKVETKAEAKKRKEKEKEKKYKGKLPPNRYGDK